jgi:hypothetical protein
MQQLRMTRHGRQRLQQRGATPKVLAIVMAYGDIELPARDGCRFLRLSRTEAGRLLQQDSFAVQDVDHARRLMVLVDHSDRVITVLKGDPEQGALGARRGGRRR